MVWFVFGEAGIMCDDDVIQGVHLERMQSFKHLGCVVNKNGIDDADIESKII